MTSELKKAEQAAHAYDGLGAPMSYRPHVAELRRQVLGPDFNGVTRAVPERWSCEPTPENQLPAPVAAADRFSETLNFYISDCSNGYSHVPRQKLVEIQNELRRLEALAHPAALSGGDSEPVAAHRTAGETIGDPMTVGYTNWRGEYAVRTITPRWLWFGATEWHKEPQWLITAYDNERGVVRDFALTGFAAPPPGEPVQGVTEGNTLRDALRLAIAIGPRCGSESLYHVIKWREQGLTLETIAKNVGISKGAVWNALKKADAHIAALATAPEGSGGVSS